MLGVLTMTRAIDNLREPRSFSVVVSLYTAATLHGRLFEAAFSLLDEQAFMFRHARQSEEQSTASPVSHTTWTASNQWSSMMLRTSLSLSAVALSFGLFAAPVSAAPTGVIGAGVTADASAVEQVARKCYRHRGHWHCREVYGYRPSVDIRIGRGHRHSHHRHRHYRD